MKVFLNKLYLPDGYEIPIKAYIQTSNNNTIGGELTPPETYNKIPHYQRWSMFRAMGVLQCVPGAQRRMGEHRNNFIGCKSYYSYCRTYLYDTYLNKLTNRFIRPKIL